MKTIRFMVILIIGLCPALATALTRDQAYELARAGDAGAIESAFAAHQAAFNAGEIGPSAYRRPYFVFSTTEPLVEASLDGWLAAYPDSPQAAAATAKRLGHIGYLVRGSGYTSATPRAALARFNRMASEAMEHAKRALDLEPRHLVAAYTLMSMAAFVGSRHDRDRGFQIIEELDHPAGALLSGLKHTYARWGGGPETTRLFCEERAPLVPDISVEECLAKADYDNAGNDRAKQLAAINTLSRGSIEHFLEQHIAALGRAGRMEEAYALARSRNYMSRLFAYAAANGLGNKSIIDDFIADNLRRDPLNPLDLVAYADYRAGFGHLEAAWEAMDKAMLYGANITNVRWRRIVLLSRDPNRKWEYMDEVISAVEATDGDQEILGSVMLDLINPDKHLTHLYNGVPRVAFECERLRLLERHQQNCEAGSPHYSCAPGLVAMRDTVIIESREQNACGEATGSTRQDIARRPRDDRWKKAPKR